MRSVTFQTVERDSVFTELDFRSKLALMATVFIVAFIWESPLLGGLLTLAVIATSIAAGVKLSYIQRVLLALVPFYIIILLTQGFFADDLLRARLGRETLTSLLRFPISWWLIGGGALTLEGLLYGLNIIFKTVTMALIVPLVVFTTDVNAMVVGMVRAGIPYKVAFVFSSTLRFFPLLFDEIQAIIEAQKLRGLSWETMGPLRRVQVYAKVAVPLILGVMVKSQTLEVVLQSKAFSGSPDRTYLHEARLGPADYVMLALSASLCLAALVAYVGWGFGRFGTFF
ncbi:MAG: energy-coupling factor transporter transmembrane component T family protein [Anaerolineae bacterium]